MLDHGEVAIVVPNITIELIHRNILIIPVFLCKLRSSPQKGNILASSNSCSPNAKMYLNTAILFLGMLLIA